MKDNSLIVVMMLLVILMLIPALPKKYKVVASFSVIEYTDSTKVYRMDGTDKTFELAYSASDKELAKAVNKAYKEYKKELRKKKRNK